MNFSKIIIKFKGIFPVKLKTSIKKFRKFNGYQELDKKLLKFLNYKNGYYIECGANDGVNQSNTWYLEKSLGWKGILIEPVKIVFKELVKNRNEKNFFFNYALKSFKFKKKNFLLNVNYNDTLISNSKKNNFNKVKVNVTNLNKILNKINAPKVIDFFSLDVEGDEFEVLNGINFNKYKFKYILIECDQFLKLNIFMKKRHYSFIKKMSIGNDYLFKFVKNIK